MSPDHHRDPKRVAQLVGAVDAGALSFRTPRNALAPKLELLAAHVTINCAVPSAVAASASSGRGYPWVGDPRVVFGCQPHRREMELAGVGATERAARNATRSHGDPREVPTVDRPVRPEELPPRQAALRDPRDPGRPSITTMSQKHSNGPQSFSRTDVIDRPRSMPTYAAGGGDASNPPRPPSPARGYAASVDQQRSPSRSM